MPDIIPNWHLIFVHFTMALFSASTGLYVLHYITKHIRKIPTWLSAEFEAIGRWCLWVTSLIGELVYRYGLGVMSLPTAV